VLKKYSGRRRIGMRPTRDPNYLRGDADWREARTEFVVPHPDPNKGLTLLISK